MQNISLGSRLYPYQVSNLVFWKKKKKKKNKIEKNSIKLSSAEFAQKVLEV